MEIIKRDRPIVLLALIVAVAGFSVVVATITLVQHASSERKLHQSIDMGSTEKRFQDIIASMNTFPSSAGRDVLFLRALTAPEATGTEGTQAVAARLKAFIDKNEAYRQLYVFSASQCLVITRDQADTDCQATVPAEVTEAMQAASKLNNDDVHVSPLVAINSPNSTEKFPSLLYASHQDTNIVVAAIDANYFLEEVRRLARPDETVLLLDRDGAYLANPDPTKERAAGSSATFYSDYSAVAKDTLTQDVRSLEAGGKAFTFHRVYPTGGGFTLSEDGAALSGDEYYWIIASVSGGQGSKTWWQANSYLPVILLIILLQLIIVGLSCLAFRQYRPQHEFRKRGNI